MKYLINQLIVILGLGLFGPAVLAHDSAPAKEGCQQAQRYKLAEAVLPAHIDELVHGISVRPQWFKNSNRFWYEWHEKDGYRYVFVDPSSGERRDLFDHDKLRLELKSEIGEGFSASKFRLRNAKLSDDEASLKFTFKGKKFLLNLASGDLIGETSSEDMTVSSPDGNYEAFVRDHNLWLREVATGQERQLTVDGTKIHSYARPNVNVKDKIADGSNWPDKAPDIVWSPDSRKIATYQLDTAGARQLSLVQSTPPEGDTPRVFDYFYALTGDKNVATTRDLIFDVKTGDVLQSELPPQPRLYYGGPNYEWSNDSSAIYRDIPGRGYKTLSLIRIEAKSGKVKVLRKDRSDSFVDYYGHYWSYDDEHDRLYWTSDDSGYAHIYAIDGKTGVNRQVTAGDWKARSVGGTSRDGKTVYVVGAGREANRDPYLRSLYAVPLEGGQVRDLTPEPFDHDTSVSPDGTYFVDNMSLLDSPTVSVLRDTRTGKIAMELGQADASAFLAAGYNFPESFETLAADGTTKIYGSLYKPADFDPSKSYPVIEYIYTGPHYYQAPKTFENALKRRNNLSMAQLGAISISVDGRGTSGRSRAFLQPAYKNLHLIGLDDHIGAIRALADRHSWIDAGRVGVYGFSAGGYDVVRAMTRYPDFYKVGVSASGNHDNRLDKAVWNEQWMGAELGPLYDRNSNVTWAKHLRGKLFLAHGELDENVPPLATLRLVDALIAANKDFELLIIPNADHFLDDSPYFHRRRWDFFTRHLIGATPDAYQMRPFDN